MSLTKVATSMVLGRPPFVNALDFINPESTAGENSAGWAALVAKYPKGAFVAVPSGEYAFASELAYIPKLRVEGEGHRLTTFKFNHIGHGFKCTSPINASTGVYTALYNIGLVNTSADNAGGAFVDIAGSFITMDHLYAKGWKYGVVLDQSEHVRINECEFAFNTTAGVWLVNGPTFTPGAAKGFTNVINIYDTQFNSTGTGIIDDGGGTHVVMGCNFNGGYRGMRIAGVSNLSITNCAMEYSVEELVYIADTKSDGVGIGPSGTIKFDTVGLIAANDKHAIKMERPRSVTILNSYFETQATGTTKSVISGAGTCYNLTTLGNNWNYYSKLADVVPAKSTQLDTVGSATQTPTQFYCETPTTLQIETYCPQNLGGSVPAGGIALSADNSAGAKTQYASMRPVVVRSGASLEAGALALGVINDGVQMVTCYVRPDGIRPGADNTLSLGGSALRWSTIYAGTGTINTSDADYKEQIEPISEAAVRAARKVRFCQYKFKDAVLAKGEGSRIHFGVIAQQVKEAFESEGLDAFAYGVLCLDEWEADGETPAGSRYGVRYDELVCLKLASL